MTCRSLNEIRSEKSKEVDSATIETDLSAAAEYLCVKGGGSAASSGKRGPRCGVSYG